MSKRRIVTNDVLQRVLRADQELSNWMRINSIYTIDTESCMSILVEKNIYEYDWKNRGYNFREDLRTLRDNNRLDIFKNIVIEQKIPSSKWFIKLRV